jgi:DUF1680 family protein
VPWTRRDVLSLPLAAGLAGPVSARSADRWPGRVRPLPLADVRLGPSRYRDALEANRRYVLSLSPDRLLADYRACAGLAPRGAPYGGWEADTIAGHTLGHYLSALALLHAQTGDATAAERAGYVVAELQAVQAAHGDGYVAAFRRKRPDGTLAWGKELFAELVRGDIRVRPFDLNGCWVPLYNWHKLMNGLRDADALCGTPGAVDVATRLAAWIAGIVDALGDERLQRVLDCEHGGLNESFADLYARTGDRRWLAIAERLYHRRVLEPLAEGRDELAGLHANTQIPKLIGLARLHELTGNPRHAAAARTFWRAVTTDHSYAIGGNSDREYFQAPRSTSRYLTEQTCEGCNTYNMLKLTRQLYTATGDASYFDFYERAHVNHVLAQQDPATGAFTYMTPLLAGAAREYSEPENSFWCCVGTGMESHAKHGDSVFWTAADALLVNLYVPSTATWRERGLTVSLTTRYPREGGIRLAVEAAAAGPATTLAMRLPGWSGGARLAVNGRPQPLTPAAGYAVVRRRWRAGDVVELTLPLELRIEPIADDPRSVALLHGPIVLAADLGPDTSPAQAGAGPALVGADPARSLVPLDGRAAEYRTAGSGRPGELTFVPFYDLHRRRSAVYVHRYGEDDWRREEQALAARVDRDRALDRRALDVVRLGDEADERAHALAADSSYAVVYRGRAGRDARTGGGATFRAQVGGRPVVLQATYWGEERNRRFRWLVDGRTIATVRLDGDRGTGFVDVEHPVPAALTAGRDTVEIRLVPDEGFTAGPVFGVRLLPAAPADGAAPDRAD